MSRHKLAVLMTIFAFLLSLASVTALPDVPPMVTLSASSTSTQTTVVLTAVAVDSLGNAGITWIKLYENGALIGERNCNGLTSCAYSKTVIHTTAGSHSYQAVARDKGGNSVSSDVVVVTFSGSNNAPVISSAIPSSEFPSVDEAATINFSVNATDADGDVLSYAWYLDGSLTTTAAIFSYTAADNLSVVENHIVHVIVSDGRGGTATHVWNISTLPVNDAPVFGTIADQFVPEDSVPSFVLDLWTFVSDEESAVDQLSFGMAQSNPSLISCTISANRNLSCATPAPNQNGQSVITITATDPDGASSSTSFIVYVTPVNDAPIITGIPDVVFNEDGYNDSIDLDTFVLDIDNIPDQLSWAASGSTNVIVVIDPVSHIVNFSALPDWFGSENVTLTVTDPDGATDSQTIVVTVIAVNDPPVVSDIPDIWLPEDGYNDSIDLDDYVYDPDDPDSAMSWSVTGNVNVIAYIDPVTHVLNVSAFPNWNGIEFLNFTATDPVGAVASDGVVVVTVSPVNDPPVVLPLPQISFAEDSYNDSLDLDGYVIDADNIPDQLSWAASGSTNVIVVIDPVSHIVNFSALPDWFGSENITLTATDPGGLSDSEIITITVTPVNDAPVLGQLSNYTIAENQSLSFIVDGFDVDGDVLDFSIIPPQPDGSTLTPINASAAIFNWTPLLNQSGVYEVTFVVSDGFGGSDNGTMYITVLDVSTDSIPPTIWSFGVAPNPVLFDNNVTFSANVTDNVAVAAVWLSIQSSNYSMPFDGSLYTVTLNSSSLGIGVWPFTIFANDSAGNIASASGSLTVSNGSINTPPSISGIPDQSVDEDSTPSWIIDLWLYASDNETPVSSLAYSILSQSNTSLISCTISGNQNLSCGTPAPNAFGFSEIVVQVSDGEFNATDVFNVTVLPVNDPPVLAFIPDITANESDLVVITASATDIDSTNLSFAINDSRFVQNNSSFSWQTGYFDAGVYAVTISVSDGLLEDSQVVQIVINNVNRAPSITSSPPTIAVVNSSYSYDVDAIDPDNESLTYSLLTAPAGMVINASSGLISWIPSSAGLFAVTVQASDPFGAAATQSFNITVYDNNIINSWIYGTYYPNNASSEVTTTNVSASSRVINSNISGSPITAIIDAYLEWVIFINVAPISNCTAIGNSTNPTWLVNTSCVNQVIDPSDIRNSNTTGTTPISNSHIWYSNVTYSGPVTNSTIDYADINGSSLVSTMVNNSSIANSDIADSAITQGSVISNSNITDSSISSSEVNDSTVNNSTIFNSSITNSTITNSMLYDAIVADASISDGVIYNGSINGVNITSPTNLTELINYPPNAAFSVSSTSVYVGDMVVFDASASSDPNIPGALNDSLNFAWSFGDGSTGTGSFIGHQYNNAGSFTVQLTVTDSFGKSDSATVMISVASQPSGGGGGGGGGYGSVIQVPYIMINYINFSQENPKTVKVDPFDVINFDFANVRYTLEIMDVDSEKASFRLHPIKFSFTLLEGGALNIALDQEAGDDLRVTLDDITKTVSYNTTAEYGIVHYELTLTLEMLGMPRAPVAKESIPSPAPTQAVLQPEPEQQEEETGPVEGTLMIIGEKKPARAASPIIGTAIAAGIILLGLFGFFAIRRRRPSLI